MAVLPPCISDNSNSKDICRYGDTQIMSSSQAHESIINVPHERMKSSDQIKAFLEALTFQASWNACRGPTSLGARQAAWPPQLDPPS